jgi:hypothetical protein
MVHIYVGKEYNAPVFILGIYNIEKIACVYGKSRLDAKNSMQECVICECTVCLNAHEHVLLRLLALCAHAQFKFGRDALACRAPLFTVFPAYWMEY